MCWATTSSSTRGSPVFIAGNSQSYTGLLEGNHTFAVQAVDRAGNVDPSPASFAWNIDLTAPTVAISPSGTTTNAASITFTYTFSEPVTGFNTHGVTVTNGTKGAFSTISSTVSTLVVTLVSNGLVMVSVTANAALDIASNGNSAASASVTKTSPPAFTSADSATFESSTGEPSASPPVVSLRRHLSRPVCRQPMAPGINYTYGTASENELTIAVVGLDSSLEGEEGDAVASPSGGDRDAIELPEVQLNFLTELRKHARKLVVVLTGGSAIAAPEVHEFADAVLQVWYPGCEGGRALADVLFGSASPSGKMPITVPRRTADLPPFEDYGMRGRTYKFSDVEPLYPFGFGLGYAHLTYGGLTLSATRLAQGEALTARTTLTNPTKRPATETVQCYVAPPRASEDSPRLVLVDFQKVDLPAGATVTVEFRLQASSFAHVDASGHRVHLPGRYEVSIGSSSPGARSEALGAPAPAATVVTLV